MAVAVLLCAVLAPAFSASTPFWEKKPWTKWSGQDCSSLEVESPWGRTFSMNLKGRNGSDDETEQTLFSSALPFRLCKVRYEQLDNKYDKMSSQQKLDFDKRIQAELATSAPQDNVSIFVYSSRFEVGLNVFEHLQAAPAKCQLVFPDGRTFTSSEPQSVKVTPDGPTSNPSVQYEVTFPRIVNGRPLLSTSDKKFTLTCLQPFQFDASKMVFQGKLEY